MKFRVEQRALIIISLIAITGLSGGEKIQNGHQAEPSVKKVDKDLLFKGEIHFKNIRQLTFSGENAEAYFSADGKHLSFQAHDGEGLCDQIYTMDLETNQISPVSNGNGITTCAYYQHPDDKKIIYASTHHVAKECPEPPDFSKGYIWKLHPGFDIFSSSIDGKETEQLTNAKGYDAEATVAFNGSKIIYTSVSSGDLEIWTMDLDGSNKKMLTDRLGYDGGPFYSHDDKKIVWRAYYPESKEEIDDYKGLLSVASIRPMALQIWTMDADGSNKKQITNNGAANFAPFFFLNDKRIIYCSNQGDPKGRNFDLWAVDIDGSNHEQITHFDGFDGFPIFSPDGKHFVFASNRNQAKYGDTNVFICEWID